ncbi:MAG: hypothetical protein ACI9SG_002000 [Maribacter sp.]|jgi:hypothetical protein
MKTMKLSNYERTQLKVNSIRGFYNHATVFVIVNILLYLLRDKFSIILLNQDALGNHNFLEWINWNVFGTTIIWGIVLTVHGIKVLGNFSLFKQEWEKRQIQKYMDESTD